MTRHKKKKAGRKPKSEVNPSHGNAPAPKVPEPTMTEQCFYCREYFPHPVALHHDMEECAFNTRKNDVNAELQGCRVYLDGGLMFRILENAEAVRERVNASINAQRPAAGWDFGSKETTPTPAMIAGNTDDRWITLHAFHPDAMDPSGYVMDPTKNDEISIIASSVRAII